MQHPYRISFNMVLITLKFCIHVYTCIKSVLLVGLHSAQDACVNKRLLYCSGDLESYGNNSILGKAPIRLGTE